MRDLTTASGEPTWLHELRIDHAVRQHRIDEAAAERGARKLTCPVCGAREHRSAMHDVDVPTGRVVVCVRCAPHIQREVDELAHRAWLDEHAEQLATLLG